MQRGCGSKDRGFSAELNLACRARLPSACRQNVVQSLSAAMEADPATVYGPYRNASSLLAKLLHLTLTHWSRPVWPIRTSSTKAEDDYSQSRDCHHRGSQCLMQAAVRVDLSCLRFLNPAMATDNLSYLKACASSLLMVGIYLLIAL